MRTILECIIWTILVALMIICSSVKADDKTLRVAVIDTGLDLTDTRLNSRLCANSSQDFTDTGLTDRAGHGTNIVGIIENRAKDANYCIVMLKFYDKIIGKREDYLGALKEAVNQNSDIVNMSLAGYDFDETEKNLVCNHPQIKFVVAAGNDSKDLAKNPVYPASYNCKNEIIVGALGPEYYGALVVDGQPKAWFSNWGDIVDVWENGTDVYAPAPNDQIIAMSGTSQATASITGKAIYILDKYAKGH